MKLDPDITLTLLADGFDGYRISTHTALGASFIKAHRRDHEAAPSEVISPAQARLIAENAEKKSLAVRWARGWLPSFDGYGPDRDHSLSHSDRSGH